MRIFWIVYLLILFIGAVLYGKGCASYFTIYIKGKKDFSYWVERYMSKGVEKDDAIKVVRLKITNAMARSFAYGSATFLFVYAIVDILFRKVIGG